MTVRVTTTIGGVTRRPNPPPPPEDPEDPPPPPQGYSAADAFLRYGSVEHWPTTPYSQPLRTTPLSGIGIAWTAGSWPVWDGREVEGRKRLWRSLDHWTEPGRFGTVEEWFSNHTVPRGAILRNTPTAKRTPLRIPWVSSWRGAGGTTSNQDNGFIVRTGENTYVSVQGARTIDAFTAAFYNFLNGSNDVQAGDFIADAIRIVAPGIPKYGSQGDEWSKKDGLLEPDWLAGPWPSAVRTVAVNVMLDPGAQAAPGGHVEHTASRRNADPTLPIDLPAGFNSRMVRPFSLLKLDITDEAIEEWLDAEGVPEMSTLRVSKRWFAIGLRDHGLRISESGTGVPIIESTGSYNPATKAAFAAVGVTSLSIARNLGQNIFDYGTLYDASDE